MDRAAEPFERVIAESACNVALLPLRNDPAAAEGKLLLLCADLAHLLGRELDGRECWGRGHWIDNILPDSVAVSGSGELVVRGMALWGEYGSSGQ